MLKDASGFCTNYDIIFVDLYSCQNNQFVYIFGKKEGRGSVLIIKYYAIISDIDILFLSFFIFLK